MVVVFAAFAAEPPPPQRQLSLGEIRIEPTAGYAGFAFPVANSELARNWAAPADSSAPGPSWAAKGVLAWQVAYNYSTVPLRVDIEHRFPFAFRGRIEVLTGYGYAREESPHGQITLYSRDVVVPPSVPTTIMLAPRVCPPASPGSPVRLQVRITQLSQSGKQLAKSSTEPVTVTQLEPAHLYSLYLDGPSGQYALDVINPGNELQLALPKDPPLDPGILSTNHYIIPVERQQVTLLPLAARDFAFVIADYAAVSAWPAVEQAALVQFMLGGGHLCLFNAGAAGWQGLKLAGGVQQVGRGWLVPVSGDFTSARQAIKDFLGGELTEFTLWAGGSSRGRALYIAVFSEGLGHSVDLKSIYALQTDLQEPLSHQRGFLHPLWLYREACASGALEPWDYPEFSLSRPDAVQSNSNLSTALTQRQISLTPLAQLAVAKRRMPPALPLLLAALPLFSVLAGLGLRPRWLYPVLAVLSLVSGAGWWWFSEPLKPPDVELTLYDVDARCTPAVARGLTAAFADRSGARQLPLADAALLRRVSWNPPGMWQVEQTSDIVSWHGQRGGPYIALSHDTPLAPGPQLPVRCTVKRTAGGVLNLDFDTRALPADQQCYLLSPLGWTVLPGGRESLRLELEIPAMPVAPGYERLAAWDALYRARPASVPGYQPVEVGEGDTALRLACATDSAPASAAGKLERLGLAGLLQNPSGLRAMAASQCVLFAPLPAAASGTDSERKAAFVRLTIALEPGP